MSPRWRRTETPSRSDEGSVTLFLAITVVGLLVLLGLVVDGGAKIRAVQHADAVAADAARAGGQAINVPAAITGAAPTVDARAASPPRDAYLRRARSHRDGRVSPTPGSPWTSRSPRRPARSSSA